jgi:hypothetical protein
MNDYFNAPDAPVDFTLARASVIKTLFASIAAAFDKLPAEDALFQGRFNFAVAAGTGNALTATFTPAPAAYVDGASFRLQLAHTNTAAATLNVNALGAKSILKSDGSAVAAGDLVAGTVQDFTYVNGAFRMPATGPAGPAGPVDPIDNVTGQDGDFYINTVDHFIFGPRAAGAWGAGVSLVGPAGANGANGANGVNGNTILYDAADPDAGDGVNGDFFINTASHTLFGPKAAGAWPAGVSLVGPAGAAGANGVVNTANLALTGTSTTQPPGFAAGVELGFRGMPKSRTVSANFTLADADRGCFIEYNDTADTCTVPANAAVALTVGCVITIVNNGTGNLTIARDAGVAMKLVGSGVDANRTLAVGGYAWLHKINTNTWFIGGSAT